MTKEEQKKRFTISEGVLYVETFEVEAYDEEQAEGLVRQGDYLTRRSDYGKPHYQVENVEDIEEKEEVTDYLRRYEAQSIECTKCDNAEEGSAPWGHFDYNAERDDYKCKSCGSFCVTVSDFVEYRDEV